MRALSSLRRTIGCMRARAYSLLEVALTFTVLAVVAAVIIPTLLSGEQAGNARAAQASVEYAVSAGVSVADLAAAPSADLTALSTFAPRLTFVSSSTSSTSTNVVSVAVPAAGSFVAAATDESGVCWGIIKRLSGTGSDRYVAASSASCTAEVVWSYRATSVSDPIGSTWSTPLVV